MTETKLGNGSGEEPVHQPLIDRIPFKKIVSVLAITFGVALGLCGVTFVLVTGSHGIGDSIIPLGFIELAVMLLSGGGLVLTVVAWLVLTAIGNFGHKGAETQRLFDDSTDKK